MKDLTEIIGCSTLPRKANPTGGVGGGGKLSHQLDDVALDDEVSLASFHAKDFEV